MSWTPLVLAPPVTSLSDCQEAIIAEDGSLARLNWQLQFGRRPCRDKIRSTKLELVLGALTIAAAGKSVPPQEDRPKLPRPRPPRARAVHTRWRCLVPATGPQSPVMKRSCHRNTLVLLKPLPRMIPRVLLPLTGNTQTAPAGSASVGCSSSTDLLQLMTLPNRHMTSDTGPRYKCLAFVSNISIGIPSRHYGEPYPQVSSSPARFITTVLVSRS